MGLCATQFVVLMWAVMGPIAPPSPEAPAAPVGLRVRVVERGTRKPVAGATVEAYPAEIIVCDYWDSPIVGDKLIGSDWAADEKLTAMSGADGIASFDHGFESGVMVVASTPMVRGARVLLAPQPEFSDLFELPVGPRRSVGVRVVDADGKPCGGIAVEFGRFMQDVEPRHYGDGDELWDELGARKVTDADGRATLDELELHGTEDLERLRGKSVGPFGARALIYGVSRVLTPVDPDQPPTEPVTLKLPACGRIVVRFEDMEGGLIESDGEADVAGARSCELAPGFPRFVTFSRGRGELFPVELGLEGELGVKTNLCDDGQLKADRSMPMGSATGPFFAEGVDSEIGALGPGPSSDRERIALSLELPREWLTVNARLLWSDGSPAARTTVYFKRTLTWPISTPNHKSVECSSLQSITADPAGRLRLLLHRPTSAGEFGLEIARRDEKGIALDRVARPLDVLDPRGQPSGHIDLGEIVLSMTPAR